MPQRTGNIQNSLALDEHIDENIQAKRVGGYGYDPVAAQWRRQAIAPDGTGKIPQATKVTTSGSVTYVAKAAPGSSQSSAVWQAKKVDTTTGVVVSWADSGNFTQIATDLTALTYS